MDAQSQPGRPRAERVDESLHQAGAEPLSLELGMLGQAGATAWFGLGDAAQLKAGDRVEVAITGLGALENVISAPL